MPTAQQYRESANQMNRLAELEEEEQQAKETVEEELDIDLDTKLASVLSTGSVLSELEEINKISETYKINATDARKMLNNFPKEYTVNDKNIPDLIKQMRKSRRVLKGSLQFFSVFFCQVFFTICSSVRFPLSDFIQFYTVVSASFLPTTFSHTIPISLTSRRMPCLLKIFSNNTIFLLVNKRL